MHPQKNCVRIFLGDYNICDTTYRYHARFVLSVPMPMLDELVEDAKNNDENKSVAHEITESGEYCRW